MSAVGPVLVAVLCHLLFLVFFIYSPSLRVAPPRPQSAVSVHMVSMKPASAKSDSVKSASTSTEPRTQPPVVSPPADVKPVPSPPREIPKVRTEPTPLEPPKPKTSLKQKTFKSTEVVKEAIKRLETVKPPETRTKPAPPAQSTDTSGPENLKSTLDRLRREVGKTESSTSAGPPSKSGSGGDAGFGSGPAGQGGGRAARLVEVYRIEIAFQIQKNWAFNEQMAGGDPSLITAIVFKVMPNGDIVDIFFTDRSSNTYLNDSAYRAIVKSSPVSPHPPGLNLPYVELGIRFTPQGIR